MLDKKTLEAFSHQMYADTSHGHEDLHKKRRKYLEDMYKGFKKANPDTDFDVLDIAIFEIDKLEEQVSA